VMIAEIETAFRGSLTEDVERELFDAWIENGDRQGWQREFARRWGRSDGWVSLTVEKFRRRLTKEHEVYGPDAFVALLGSLLDAEDDPALYETPAEEETAPEPADERVWVLRDRLRDSLALGSRERQLFEDCSAGCPREEIRRRYPDEEVLLVGLHQRYVGL